MSNNVERFGNILTNRMLKTVDYNVPTSVELGVINDGLSLTPDSLQAAIPYGEYMSPNEELKPGDRVLVAWCRNEPVVIAPVSESAEINKDRPLTFDEIDEVTP